MNKQEIIRNACLGAKEKGIKLVRGPWFDLTGSGELKLVGCCAIGAVLLSDDNFEIAIDSCTPGYLKKACEMLECDSHWLIRFWMGFDRGHQVMLISDKDKESKDDVSSFGIQLAKEFVDDK